jgi:DMSO reductase anchor subunit
MHCIYRIKARPFWNHWQVLSSFFGTMFSLGAILIGLFCLPLAWLSGIELSDLVKELSAFVSFGLLLEGVGHFFHARDLQRKGQEGNASFQVLKSKFGKTYIARNISLTFCILAISLLPLLLEGTLLLGAFYLTSLIVLCTALVSRALFYVLVIPTTMPGAFFWKNKGFENHARETGLAKLPQVGVVEFDH